MYLAYFAEGIPSLLSAGEATWLKARLSLFLSNQKPRPTGVVMTQVGPGSSVVAAEDAGEFALDADLGGDVALGVVGSVCGVEADHGAFAAEVF